MLNRRKRKLLAVAVASSLPVVAFSFSHTSSGATPSGGMPQQPIGIRQLIGPQETYLPTWTLPPLAMPVRGKLLHLVAAQCLVSRELITTLPAD